MEERDEIRLLKALESIAESQESLAKSEIEIAATLDKIQQYGFPSPYAVKFQIYAVQENEMQKGKIVAISGKGAFKAGAPTQISDSQPQAIAVFGTDAEGVLGAPLAPGATIVMSAGVGANGTPGTFVQDANPGAFNFTDSSGVARTGVQSIASGVFTPSPAPNADVNDPFAISYVITGGSGDSGSAQFETAVGVEVSEVIGLPTAATAAKASSPSSGADRGKVKTGDEPNDADVASNHPTIQK